MVKFKKYSIRFMCIVSVVFTFMTALFYPIESFKADVVLYASSNYGSYSFRTIAGSMEATSGDHLYYNDYDQVVPGYVFMDENGSNMVLKHGHKYNILLTFNYFLDVRGSLGSALDLTSSVKGTSQFYFIFGGERYEILPYSSTDTSGTGFLNIVVDGSDSVTFSIGCESDLLLTVPQITYTDYSRMFNYYYAVSLSDISIGVFELTGEDALTSSDSVLNDTLNAGNQLQEDGNTILQGILDKLVDFMGLEGDETLEDVPTDDMVDLGTKEDDLLGSTTPDDAANSIDVTIDADSSAVIWDIINDIVTSNGVVFGGFISLLSLGVIALILNR